MEDFASDIFDALDDFEDFDSIEDEQGFSAGDSDLPTDAANSEATFFEDCDFVPTL